MTPTTVTTSCTACGKPFQFAAGHACGETPVERELRDELAMTRAKLAIACPEYTQCGKCGATTPNLIVWRWPGGSSSALCRPCVEEVGLPMPEEYP